VFYWDNDADGQARLFVKVPYLSPTGIEVPLDPVRQVADVQAVTVTDGFLVLIGDTAGLYTLHSLLAPACEPPCPVAPPCNEACPSRLCRDGGCATLQVADVTGVEIGPTEHGNRPELSGGSRPTGAGQPVQISYLDTDMTVLQRVIIDPAWLNWYRVSHQMPRQVTSAAAVGEGDDQGGRRTRQLVLGRWRRGCRGRRRRRRCR
jgi:hypothetical protein